MSANPTPSWGIDLPRAMEENERKVSMKRYKKEISTQIEEERKQKLRLAPGELSIAGRSVT